MEPRFRRLVWLLPLLTLATGCMVAGLVGYMVDPDLSPKWGMKFYDGLTGEARITRDEWGVPHIYADNEDDLFFAIGYAQAQDRMFQLDMMRHFINGRLAELIGESPLDIIPGQGTFTTVDQDKMYRTIGFRYLGEVGAELIKIARPDSYRILERHAAGINAAIEEAVSTKTLPMEFRLLKHEPEKWKPADTIALGRYLGWSLMANLPQELMRYSFVSEYGAKKAWDLIPRYKPVVPGIPTIVPRSVTDYTKIKPRKPLGSNPAGATHEPPLPPADPKYIASLVNNLRAMTQLTTKGFASNNWVVSSKKSKSGKPILANDPHLVHMMPSVMWAMHIKGAGYECYGVTFPGMPVIVLGHTRHLAWGLTTSRADVADVYIEKVNPDNPDQYEYMGKWENFVERDEPIKVRKGMFGPMGETIDFKVRSSRHGPLINSMSHHLPENAPPMALRWVGYDLTSDPRQAHHLITASGAREALERLAGIETGKIYTQLDTMIVLNQGRDIEDFKNALETYTLPNQNWVFADDSGNIAYIAGGRVPIRENHDGLFPVDGSTDKYEWLEFIPWRHLPQAFNPERGWIATANNEVVPPDDYPYVFSFQYGPGYRAARIEELLQEKDKLDVNDMVRIQNDVFMVQARIMLPRLLEILAASGHLTTEEMTAMSLLDKWPYYATTESVACTIFHEWRRQIIHLMLEDDLGDLFFAYTNEGVGTSVIDGMIVNGSPYFDDINTPETETRQQIVRKAFEQAVAHLTETMGKDVLKWEWGRVHTVTFSHPAAIGPLKKALNYGPFPHSGSSGTVRNAGYSGIGDTGWRAVGGPVLRHIIDMADVDNALLVFDGSQSGQWKSPHYKDGNQLWHQGKYMKALMDPAAIAESSEGLLILKPLPR